MTDEEHIMLCAVRYGLGRRTYITSVISDYVGARAEKLSEHAKSIIIRDIQQAKEEEMLGDKCDADNWLSLVEKLELTKGSSHAKD